MKWTLLTAVLCIFASLARADISPELREKVLDAIEAGFFETTADLDDENRSSGSTSTSTSGESLSRSESTSTSTSTSGESLSRSESTSTSTSTSTSGESLSRSESTEDYSLSDSEESESISEMTSSEEEAAENENIDDLLFRNLLVEDREMEPKWKPDYVGDVIAAESRKDILYKVRFEPFSMRNMFTNVPVDTNKGVVSVKVSLTNGKIRHFSTIKRVQQVKVFKNINQYEVMFKFTNLIGSADYRIEAPANEAFGRQDFSGTATEKIELAMLRCRISGSRLGVPLKVIWCRVHRLGKDNLINASGLDGVNIKAIYSQVFKEALRTAIDDSIEQPVKFAVYRGTLAARTRFINVLNGRR